MPQKEQFGFRDECYSAWHRTESLSRFMPYEAAKKCGVIDLDVVVWAEYNDATKEVIALIETAEDRGQGWKPASVITSLCRKAGIAGYTVLYKKSAARNPRDNKGRHDIEQFRVRRVHPAPERDFKLMAPDEYAEMLNELRIEAFVKHGYPGHKVKVV